MISSAPQIVNAPLSDLPAYTGCYVRCRVHHLDHNTNTAHENYISEEDAAFLRNLYYKHQSGLIIKTDSLADKVKLLEHKGLVSKISNRFYLTALANDAEYTMVPRVLFMEDSNEVP